MELVDAAILGIVGVYDHGIVLSIEKLNCLGIGLATAIVVIASERSCGNDCGDKGSDHRVYC